MAFKLVVARGERAGMEVPLEGQEAFVVGSAAEADIRMADRGILAHHVRLIPDGARLILVDVSGTGVPLNGQKATTAELRVGDEIVLGAAVLRIDESGSKLEPRTDTKRAGRVRSTSGKIQSPVYSRKPTPDSRPALAPADPPAADSRPSVPRAGRPTPPPAAAGLPPPANLYVVRGTDRGKHFVVSSALTIGRSASVSVPLLDMGCSREHARVERRPDGYYLVDLGSTNGTKINEVRVESRSTTKLRSGDLLRISKTVIEFRNAGEPPTAKAEDTTYDAIEADSDAAEAVGDTTMRLSGASGIRKAIALAKQGAASLGGDLEKMGFADVVQFLNLTRKSGELVIRVVGGEGSISFFEGNVHDAWGAGGKTPEDNFYAMAALRRGHFEFHENRPLREARIKTGTLALLMEAMRRRDEANG